MELDDWFKHLEQLHANNIDLSLDRVRAVAPVLGLDHPNARIITVGGTNGKGSTVSFLKSIYTQAGYRIGVYTSPHLLHFHERIHINGADVTTEQLVTAFSVVETARHDHGLTYFEFTTLAALWLLQQADLDLWILEVGMGGRLDAVNIMDADVSMITSISIDHTEYLGHTRVAIGFEKAGIFRSNRPGIVGESDVPQSVYQYAKDQNVPLYIAEQEFKTVLHDNHWDWKYAKISGSTAYFHLPITKHLVLSNAASSLMAITCLQTVLPVKEEAIRAGIQLASMAGRFQIETYQGKTVILDIAHNPAAAAKLAEKLADYYSNYQTGMDHSPKIYAVIAMLKDKDANKTIQAIKALGLINEWHLASLEGERGRPAYLLQEAFHAKDPVFLHKNVVEAYDNVVNRAYNDDLIVVFGSFYTVAAVLSLIRDPMDR